MFVCVCVCVVCVPTCVCVVIVFLLPSVAYNEVEFTFVTHKMQEAARLHQINALDDADVHHIVRLKRAFYFHQHMCIATEMLQSFSLLPFIQNYVRGTSKYTHTHHTHTHTHTHHTLTHTHTLETDRQTHSHTRDRQTARHTHTRARAYRKRIDS